MKKTLLYCFLILIPFAGVCAQKVTVEALMDSTVIMIGDQTRLSLLVTQMPEQQVTFPLYSETIPGGLDIAEPLKVDTIHNPDGYITVKHDYVVTAFEDSLLYIAPFPFVESGDTIWSKSLSLKVVQPFEIEEEPVVEPNTIADIKPVYNPPINWVALFKVFLLVVLILALAVGVFVIICKYIQKRPVFQPVTSVPELPPHVVALNGLNKIKDEKLWQQGRLKEYYTELTDVLRVYIEKLFGINAMEMTSDEILEGLRFMRKEQTEAYNKLYALLQTADLVKFAKWNPTSEENEKILKNAYFFIEQTKIEEEPPAIPSVKTLNEEIQEKEFTEKTE